MSYRKEFYLDGNRIFVTKGNDADAYFALASAKGQAWAFALATNGKVAVEQIELRIFDDTKPREQQQVVVTQQEATV